METKGIENIHTNKTKDVITSKRRVLRDISQNEPLHRALNVLKGQDVDEKEKKGIVASKTLTRSYKHVQAKVNSGLPTKTTVKGSNDIIIKPTKREESTVLLQKARVLSNVNTLQNKVSNINLKKSESKENLIKIKETKRKEQHVVEPISKESTHKKLETNKYKELSDEIKFDCGIVNKKSFAYSTDLLEGVEDIDKGQEKNVSLMSIYVKDIYTYLREMESKHLVRPHYLEQHTHMTPKMRSMLIDWLVQVHNQFNLLLETLHLTISIIDRYLQTKPDIPRMQIQLVGITAMFIASKYEEMFPPEINDYTYITDNTYTKKDILKCEKAILKKLDFQLGRPLPIHFVRRLIKAANTTLKEHALAKYLIDLSLVDYEFVHYRPSELASAAVCLSIALLSNRTPRDCWSRNLEFYSGYSFIHISPIFKKMSQTLSTIKSSRYTAVTEKYATSKFGKISTYPELGNAAKYCK